MNSETSIRRRVLLRSAAAIAVALAINAFAQHEQHGQPGEAEAQSGESGGGDGHGGHGGGGGHGGKHGGGGHGGMGKHAMPGMVEEKCPEAGEMPPHYCEPSYKVMSSVRGVRVSDVSPAGDREVMVTLVELNAMSPGVAQRLVLVGGSGDLAGATTLDGGWKQTATVHLKLQGDGSIYGQRAMHLHLFPLTGP